MAGPVPPSPFPPSHRSTPGSHCYSPYPQTNCCSPSAKRYSLTALPKLWVLFQDKQQGSQLVQGHCRMPQSQERHIRSSQFGWNRSRPPSTRAQTWPQCREERRVMCCGRVMQRQWCWWKRLLCRLCGSQFLPPLSPRKVAAVVWPTQSRYQERPTRHAFRGFKDVVVRRCDDL